jgi:hypothetical protein
MSQTGTSAWWADVQHLRDAAERTDEARRRADRAELAARRAARDRRRSDESEPAPSRRRSDEPEPGLSRRRSDEPEPAPSRRRDHVDGAGHGARPAAGAGMSSRRTVEIRGRTVPAPAVPRSHGPDRRRPPRQAAERVGSRPDRLALWALVMGLVLILVAVSTADAAAVAGVAAL